MASWDNTLVQGVLTTTKEYRVGEQCYNLASLSDYGAPDSKLDLGDGRITIIETYGERMILPSRISMPVDNNHTVIRDIFEYGYTNNSDSNVDMYPYSLKIGNGLSNIIIDTGRMYISNNLGYFVDLFGTNNSDLELKTNDINIAANNIKLNLIGSISANNTSGSIPVNGNITVNGQLLVTGDASEFANVIKMRDLNSAVSYDLVSSEHDIINNMHEFIFGDKNYGDKFTVNIKKFIINDRNIRKTIMSVDSDNITIGNDLVQNLEIASRGLNLSAVEGGSVSINADNTISLTTKGPSGYYTRNMISVTKSTAAAHEMVYGTYESTNSIATDHTIRGKSIVFKEKYTTPILNLNKNGLTINTVTDYISNGEILLKSTVDKFSANIIKNANISNTTATAKNIILGKFENGTPSISIGDTDSNVYVTTPVFVAGRSQYIGSALSQDEALAMAPFKLDNNNIQLGYTDYTRNVNICGGNISANITTEAKLYFDNNNKISFINDNSNKKVIIKTGSINNEVGSIYNSLSGGYATTSNGGTIQLIASGNTGSIVLNSGKNLIMSSAGNTTIESSNMVANKNQFYTYIHEDNDTNKYASLKISPGDSGSAEFRSNYGKFTISDTNIGLENDNCVFAATNYGIELANNYGRFRMFNDAILLASKTVSSNGNSLDSAYMQILHENGQGSSDLILQAGSSMYIKMHSANTTNSQGTSIARVIDINAPHLRLTSNNNNIVSYTGAKDLYIGNPSNGININSDSYTVSLNSRSNNINTTAIGTNGHANMTTTVFSSNNSTGTTIQSVADYYNTSTSSINLNDKDITIDAEKLVLQLKKLVIDNLNAIQGTMVGNKLPDETSATEGQIFFVITNEIG